MNIHVSSILSIACVTEYSHKLGKTGYEWCSAKFINDQKCFRTAKI